MFSSGARAVRHARLAGPAKIANRGAAASDIVTALREQNVRVAAGSVGQQWASPLFRWAVLNTLDA